MIRITPAVSDRKTTNLALVTDERPITTETSNLMSALPGFAKWQGWDRVFRPSASNVQYIIENWPEARWEQGTESHVRDYLNSKLEAEALVSLQSKDIDAAADKFKYKRQPRVHQRKAFHLSRNMDRYALLMEQRTGKTKVCIDTAAYLWKRAKITAMIIVSVNGIHRNWVDIDLKDDLPNWCPYVAYFHRAHLSRSTSEFNSTVLKTRSVADPKLAVFSFNFDAFSRKDSVAKDRLEFVLANYKCLMIIDESTRIKNSEARRTRYLVNTGQAAAYRRILTGTPVTKSPVDLKTQFDFLDPDIIGYDTKTTFKAHFCDIIHCTKAGFDFEIVKGYKNLDELAKKIAPYSYRVLRSQCMDLPAKTYQRWPVEMTPDQARLYRDMRDEFMAELDGNTLTAMMVMTRYVRLQQIVCNWWPMEADDHTGKRWSKVRPISKVNSRLTAVDNIIEEYPGAKLVFWSRFKPDMLMLMEHLGSAAVGCFGGISADQKQANYNAFRKDASKLFMVANPASASMGYDFSISDTEVFLCNSFDAELRWQAEDRIVGKGNSHIIDLECLGTIDSQVIKILKSKKDVADAITGDPRVLFLEEDTD